MKPEILRRSFNALLIIIGILIFVIFFKGLFFPELRIYATPDYGRSEILSLNYPLKDFLGQSLKNGTLPFWNKSLGGGYPLFAEGIMGSLYIPNIILFGLLPTEVAWNLSYVLIFLLIFSGSYLYSFKNLKNKPASFFASIVFTFSGFNIVHIPHFPLLQAISLFPLLLFTGQLLWEAPTKTNILIFALLLAQQIFIGHPQITFITLFTLLISFIYLNRDPLKTIFFKKTRTILIGILMGILFASPQILPGLELNKLSVFGLNGLNRLSEMSRFPYSLKYLTTSALPYFFGDPAKGTFKDIREGGSIYWEINSFIGITALFFAILVIVIKNKGKWDKLMIIIIIISIVLCLSYRYPLNLIYLLPGFNLFRVSSRFLLAAVFSLSMASGAGLKIVSEILSSKRRIYFIIFYSLIVFVSTYNLFSFALKYNPTIPVSLYLKAPQTVKDIPEGSRILSDPSLYKSWNESLDKYGWRSMEKFIYYLNGLGTNENLLYGIDNITPELSAATLRQSLIVKYPDYYLLGSSTVRFLTTAKQFPSESPFRLKKTYFPEDYGFPEIYLYENDGALPRFRIISSYVVKPFNYQYPDWDFSDKDKNFSNSVLLEKIIDEKFEIVKFGNISVIKDSDRELILNTNTDKKALLVVSDSYYPGWTASVNGKSTEIYAANINQRAIILPPGDNTVLFKYVPYSFYYGILISVLSLFLFRFVKVP